MLKSFIIFCLLSLTVAALSGCGGASNTATGNAAGKGANPANDKSGKAQSTYPPLKAEVADADIEMPDGTMAKISDRRGKVVLINLWGIWCGPCRAEMPHLIDLQNKYKDRGFEVLGLNIGDDNGQPEDFAKIKAFGEKTGLNYDLARAPRATAAQIYRVANFDGVPLSLLVDRDGHLRAVLRGGGPTAINQMKDSVDKAMLDSGS